MCFLGLTYVQHPTSVPTPSKEADATAEVLLNFRWIISTPSHIPGCLPRQLNIKVNAICTIQGNLCIDKGLVHNARVQIVSVHRYFAELKLLHGEDVSLHSPNHLHIFLLLDRVGRYHGNNCL
ncbi:hypothetical protein HD554DRAFT_2095418 [Boletus coccyginus]|nr:hypothetical protein HD554DRAFT_2095418 [Boletus coccyginus]